MHSLRCLTTLCRAVILAAPLLAALHPASATSLNARLNEARALLEGGAPAEALEAYREVLVDAPESGPALLGIACATYRQAEDALGADDKETAKTLFETAREAFSAIDYTHTKEERAVAAFDGANAVARVAKMSLDDAEAEPNLRPGAIKALEGAVEAYENVLDAYPGHAGAQQNLDHVRYLLKSQLQQEEEEQPEMRLYSIIQRAETDLPGRTVQVLPAETPPPTGDGTPQPAPPGGNTAVLTPAGGNGP